MEDRKVSSSETSPVEEWLKFSDDIITFVQNPPMAGARARVPPEYYQAGRFLMFQWGRSFRTFQALLLLVRSGYSEDATVLLRTLLEGFFEIAFMAKHPHEADRYLAYGSRTQATDFKRVREEYDFPDEMKAAASVMEAKSLISDPERKMKPKKGPRSGWHPKFRSVRQRAIEAGVPSFYYDMVYGFTSRYVHGSGDWMAEFFSPFKEKSRISYKGDTGTSALATMMTCECIVEILKILDGCLNFELGEPLKDLLMRQSKIRDENFEAVLSKYNISESK